MGGGVGGGTWRQFEAVGAVLQKFGALSEEWEATEFGDLVTELGGDNELWLALVTRHTDPNRRLLLTPSDGCMAAADHLARGSKPAASPHTC